MTLNLYRDANGAPIPQTVDDNGNITVYATGDTTGVEFCKTKLLRDCSGAVIPNQIYDVNLGQWIIDISGGGSGGGNINLPISANDVRDTTSRVLVSPSQRAQIDANTTELASHSQRISDLETDLSNVTSTDEKVKINANSTAGYLEEFLDGVTILNDNDKLKVPFIESLSVTPQEVNALAGATANIQAQINGLSSITNVREIVDTEEDLPTTVPESGTILVREDSTQDGATTFYTSNGTNWVYGNRIESGLARDFTTNPIDLNTETTGILPKSKYEKQNASETPITDANGNLVATNVEDALTELFTYANNLKSIATVIGSPLSTSDTSEQLNAKTQQLKVLFASYLTQKGVIAYPYNTVEEMINKILTIPNITLEGSVEKISKLNVTAPYELRITLDEQLQLNDITTTPIEFVQGDTGIVHYNLDFDNSEASDFLPNDKVVFDGKARLRTNYTLEMTRDESWQFEGELQRELIIRDNYQQINKIDVLQKVQVI